MAFAIETSQLVAIRSRADAAKHYQSTAAIRGYVKSSYGVPLRYDRTCHGHMRLIYNPGSDSYSCRLYRTDVVTFLPNGHVYLDLSYASQSTAKFANAFLPYIAHPTHPGYFRVVLTDNRLVLYTPTGAFIPHAQSDRLILDLTDPTPLNPATPCRLVLNKSRAAATRKLIAPLLAYIKTLNAANPAMFAGMTNINWEQAATKWIANPTIEDMTNPDLFWSIVRTAAHCRYKDAAFTATSLRNHAYSITGCYDRELVPIGTYMRGCHPHHPAQPMTNLDHTGRHIQP